MAGEVRIASPPREVRASPVKTLGGESARRGEIKIHERFESRVEIKIHGGIIAGSPLLENKDSCERLRRATRVLAIRELAFSPP